MTTLPARLMALPKFGDGVGLHRVQYLLDQVHRDFPDYAPEFIKVTGSNGKGSTCAMISAILRCFGLCEGLFTSPHLVRFNERIAVAGQHIDDEDLAACFKWVQAATRQYQGGAETFGAFECYTALAYRHFAALGVRHGCFEAGIGGRYDSVRPLPGSVCALTSLDLEHTQLLGERLELIGYDKLDLCPPAGTMVLFPVQDPDLLTRLHAYANLRQIHLFETATRCRLSDVRPQPGGFQFRAEIDGLVVEDLTLPLLGEHQLANALVAMAAVKRYLQRLSSDVSDERLCAAFRTGLAEVTWPGRASFVPGPPPLYYDVGHTPQAIEAFVATVAPRLAGQRVLLVTGVSHNKAVAGILTALVGLADHVICTRAWHMGAPVALIEETVAAVRPDLPRECCATIEAAMARARQLASAENAAIVVAGGLFLAVEAMHAYQGHDPRALRFF